MRRMELVVAVCEVRALHAPDADLWSTWMHCTECSTNDETVSWPCATALLVYTPEEIQDTAHWHTVWQRWIKAANFRRRLAHPPSPFVIEMANAADRWLLDAARHSFIADRLLQSTSPHGEVVKYSVGAPMLKPDEDDAPF